MCEKTGMMIMSTDFNFILKLALCFFGAYAISDAIATAIAIAWAQMTGEEQQQAPTTTSL
jgi:hypothetical protein